MQLIQTINTLNSQIIAQTPNGLTFVSILWMIHAVNVALGHALNLLGIYPRRLFGLIGIFTSPWIHAGFDHLFFNSIPLCILFTFLLTQGFVHAISVTLGIIVIGGSLTWLLGRPAIHIGASGLIMGYMGFILTESYMNRSPAAWIIGVVILYYLGSILLSLIPGDRKVSFEGHIFGFVSGVFLSVYPVDYFYPFASSISPSISHVFQTIQSVF